ncbi:venom acid phosphatase Acph-1-like [Temnothorax nylanderi]|uniref:venom acid phosphatase Acph-1-like n=1 Tax=Temnothorax nylanderi TaxID=102681 RepID=UPI003A89FBB8
MGKFQRLVDIVLIFYFCSLTTSGISTPAPSEPKDIDAENDYLELRLVSAVFRHGDRTVDRTSRESYPNDPYKSNNFYPDGDGQLTNAGKKRAYKLGLMLRDRYNSFLGDVYYQPNVHARSTWLTRSKMTLQLVLAALYPPVDIQKWNSELPWQPMDLIYIPQHEDDLLVPIGCPTYVEAYKNLLQSPEVKKKIGEFNNLMEIASNYTGRNITNLTGLVLLYSTLYAQSLMELPLPQWTQDIFPDGKLFDAALLFLDLLSYDQLNNLNGGVLLRRLIDDMNKVINGTLGDRKINLFSAHDLNVAGILHALNISERRLPAYTSSVIVELHEKTGMYFVKVLHYLGIPGEILEISIPGCEILCPYNKFVELTASTKAFEHTCRPANAKINRTSKAFALFEI